LSTFFMSLFQCLARGARAVFQFYPENPDQMELVTSSAMKCGFTGGVLVDFPNSTKAKKYFLVLFAGAASNFQMPAAQGTEESDHIAHGQRETSKKGKKHRVAVKRRSWVLEKKERQRRQGRDVREDSKYTGRKRRPKF